MKPLYIDRSDAVVDLDQTALCVTSETTARQWFPLRRISRVVSGSRVAWETRALLACAKAGIGVHFVDRDGNVIAHCLGRTVDRYGISQRWVDFVIHPDREELFEVWCRAMQAMAVASAMRRMGWRGETAPRAAHLTAALREAARENSCLAGFERSGVILKGLLLAWCCSFFAQAGFDAEMDCKAGKRINLIDVFADMLWWDFQPMVYRRLLARVPEDAQSYSRAAQVAIFEQREQRIWRLAQGLLSKLDRWLRGIR